MRTDEYSRFLEQLTRWAGGADGVLGLVLVGSTAGTAHAPDAHSDHDFFVIAEPSAVERLRATTAWLPPRQPPIALHERDTDHGAWVVYADGHLLEYAVFTPDELALARTDAHRVVVDRSGDLAERIRPTLAPAPHEPAQLATALHRALLVGAGRAARGELLAARWHLLQAAGSLLELVHALVPSEQPAADAHNPWRRVERTHPAVAAELHGILARSDPEAALALAQLAERVAGTAPWWPAPLAAAVRHRLAALAAPTDGPAPLP